MGSLWQNMLCAPKGSSATLFLRPDDSSGLATSEYMGKWQGRVPREGLRGTGSHYPLAVSTVSTLVVVSV